MFSAVSASRIPAPRTRRTLVPTKEHMATKTEKITPPTKRETKDASKLLRDGHSAGGRVLNEKKQAIKQGVAKKGK